MTQQTDLLEHAPSVGARQPLPSSGECAPSTPFERRESFTACIAHELRGPIALQRALVEVTLADPHADTAALREMGERVIASCTRQQRLIEALLELARSGRGPRRQEPVDLATVTAAALQAHDLSELESVVTLERAQTTGDTQLLELLAANLLSNAVRHNVTGGRIEVATGTTSGRAVLSVANTGPLIPAGELRRLFQAFERLAPDVPDAPAGVGLGLAIVQAISDAHGAFMFARPRSAGGLEIEVSLPSTPSVRVEHGVAKGTALRRMRRPGRLPTPTPATIIQP